MNISFIINDLNKQQNDKINIFLFFNLIAKRMKHSQTINEDPLSIS
jgi:hypothetical protein